MIVIVMNYGIKGLVKSSHVSSWSGWSS